VVPEVGSFLLDGGVANVEKPFKMHQLGKLNPHKKFQRIFNSTFHNKKLRMSKFYHECGAQLPDDTAKFFRVWS